MWVPSKEEAENCFKKQREGFWKEIMDLLLLDEEDYKKLFENMANELIEPQKKE
jgi:hypothetical protein